jgi:hypothetical protein
VADHIQALPQRVDEAVVLVARSASDGEVQAIDSHHYTSPVPPTHWQLHMEWNLRAFINDLDVHLLFVGHQVSETCVSVWLTNFVEKSAGFARGPAAPFIASMAAPVSLHILAFHGVFLVSQA